MKFSELAASFEKMEGTSSRIELTQILSSLFKNVSTAEVEKVAYLLQGRVVPFFDPTEIGMADKMVDQAIASAYGVDREEVQKLAAKVGEMGLAAEEFSKKKKTRDRKLTVADIHSGLYNIANTSGEGSVEKKISALSELLKKSNYSSAKFLIRITLAKLRLGVGDSTILDALSTAKFGDKSARQKLEEAYNKTSDLGFVAKTLWSQVLPAIEKV